MAGEAQRLKANPGDTQYANAAAIAVMDELCPRLIRAVFGGGLSACPAAIDAALAQAYQALVTANGGSTNVAGWTQDTATQTAGQTMPLYDDIQFTTVGVIGQPAIDWQNRPTFQQVAEFPAHR